MRVRLIRHDAVPRCGSFEIRFLDERPSWFIYWDDIPGRRLRTDAMDQAREAAKAFARSASQ
jgi:hypothetical protein